MFLVTRVRFPLIIFCSIQVKSEYRWRWFDLDERRGLPIIPLPCFRAGGGCVSAQLGRAKGLVVVE
ncbi:hypothetical protein Hanom_Chr14g01325811 [Helianthus anomalus]